MADEQQQDFNPDTHVRGDDGKIYEKTFIHAVGVASGAHVDGQEKSDLNKRIEAAMSEAAQQAINEGLMDDHDAVRARMLAARDRVVEGA